MSKDIYSFEFSKLVKYLNNEEITSLEEELNKLNNECKKISEGKSFEEKRQLKCKYSPMIKEINDKINNLTVYFIKSYEELRTQILFFDISKIEKNAIHKTYCNFIKTNIVDQLKKLLKNNDVIPESMYSALYTADDTENLKLQLSKLTDHLNYKSMKETDLCILFAIHMVTMIYKVCILYKSIFIDDNTYIDLVLVFCHGDYHTLKYKDNNAYHYLEKFISGDLHTVTGKGNLLKNTPDAIELSYDISNEALPMFTDIKSLKIFLDTIHLLLQRICIINCLNYITYAYTYQLRNTNKPIKVNKNTLHEYVDNIYIKNIEPLLKENGELIFYGGDSHNILGERFKNLVHVGNFKDLYNPIIQISLYKKQNTNLNGGSRKTKLKRKIHKYTPTNKRKYKVPN